MSKRAYDFFLRVTRPIIFFKKHCTIVPTYINLDKIMAKPKTEDSSAEDAKKIVDDAKNFIEKAIADIGKTSATKQLILGTASGWITGFITMKIGKVAAVGLGGGVILLHIASQKGYIDINWEKINKKVDKISDKIEKETTGKSPDWFEKVLLFVKDNSYYSAGFTGGFLFGVASS